MLGEVGDAQLLSSPCLVGHRSLLLPCRNQELTHNQTARPQAACVWSAVSKLYLAFSVHLHRRSSVPGDPQTMGSAPEGEQISQAPQNCRCGGWSPCTIQQGACSRKQVQVGSYLLDPFLECWGSIPEHADGEAELSWAPLLVSSTHSGLGSDLGSSAYQPSPVQATPVPFQGH